MNSISIRHSTYDEQERERGFRNLAGCWANDKGNDDMEAIIRQGRAKRGEHKELPICLL